MRFSIDFPICTLVFLLFSLHASCIGYGERHSVFHNVEVKTPSTAVRTPEVFGNVKSTANGSFVGVRFISDEKYSNISNRSGNIYHNKKPLYINMIRFADFYVSDNCNSKRSNKTIYNSTRKHINTLSSTPPSLLLLCSTSTAEISPFESQSEEAGEGGDEPALELNDKNVESVLDEVRPYLVADGGNCKLVKIVPPVIYLQLQGNCGTCPSSVVTVKMGIERRLKERFPTLSHVETVSPEVTSSGESIMLDKEGIENVLDGIRPFLRVTGGDIKLISLSVPREGVGASALLQFTGKISRGISLSIKNEVVARVKKKFPMLNDIVIKGPNE